MRNEFCQAMMSISTQDDFVFLTGDLGFKALEPLRDAAGSRFINCGIAEQNMVSVAAGLARDGMRPWAYSIAPFIYARPFEQIRNDVCLHDLPVKIVGNGGGYGYGVMGATHHALEDYGVMLTLANMHVFVPAFNSDVQPLAQILHRFQHPAYLRLGYGEWPIDMPAPAYAPWRRVLEGGGPLLVIIGPLAGGVLQAVRSMDFAKRPELWVVSQLPITVMPTEFLQGLRRSQHLFVVEEHVAWGSAGQALAYQLMAQGLAPRRFTHRAASGYLSGLYGSQKFHRRENGLNAETIYSELMNLE